MPSSETDESFSWESESDFLAPEEEEKLNQRLGISNNFDASKWKLSKLLGVV